MVAPATAVAMAVKLYVSIAVWTASIVTDGGEAPTVATTPFVAVPDAPKPPSRRLSLTLPALAGAARIIIAGQGEAKAEVVRRALEPGSILPVGMLISRARDVRVLLVK
jgi:6-phosphogluconolactonase/glucosamine-6-phosphate isomerase/deaminase